MKVLRKRRWLMVLLFGLAILVSLGCWWNRLPAGGPGVALAAKVNFWGDRQAQTALDVGFAQAEDAATLARRARTVDEWDRVVNAWTAAIATLQTIPTQSPERFFVQRKQRDYLANLALAQQQADQLPNVFPSLGSAILDDQLRLYLSYIATVGPPDILIMGSSRSLQGLDPQQLESRLNQRGYPVRVFNFSVNGATAQVMNFIVQKLLTPEQLPQLIIWGDGSRAFNSRRVDATFAQILKSPGYQAVLVRQRPGFGDRPTIARKPSNIDAHGFLSVPSTFDPAVFYQTYPQVSGRYDGFYNPFDLSGLQEISLRSLVGYLRRLNIGLVYVNLPLSGDYLDPYRLRLDQEFQQFLQTQGQRLGFDVIDLLTQWINQNQFFADPSHLNQQGAAALSQQLASDPRILEKLTTQE